MFNLEALQPLVVSIMTDWMISTNKWERDTMLKIARHGRNISFRCCAFVTGLITFSLYFYLLKFFKNIHLPHRSLVYPMENIQKSPTYEITYFIQLSGGIYTVFANYAIDNFVSIIVLHVCAQLINLRTTLNNLVNELANKSISTLKFREGLAAIVVRHEDLIRYARKIFGALLLYSIIKYL